MKKVIVHFKEPGEVEGVYLQASPEAVYEKFFNSAKRKATKHPDSFENGIQAIVFGAFLLEALCNYRFKSLLLQVVREKRHARAIWRVVKSISWRDKVLIASTITQVDAEDVNDNLAKLQNVFDLRNRLAHFKDNESLLVETIDLQGLANLLESLPEPELVTLLTGDKLKQQIAKIGTLKKWINRAFGFEKPKTKRKLVTRPQE
jgi:hypothetical protein